MAEGLFTWPSDAPQLIGSEHEGVISFPPRPGETQRLLGRTGTLWSFTTQQFRPPSPPYDGDDTAESFRSYAIGYVELPGELLVQARLTEADPERLRIGQEMELMVVPYTTRPDGTEILTFAFAPVAGAQGPAGAAASGGTGESAE
ncbi:OB-fold domain-containing protein [Frankia sp. CcI49]|uniref:Zn-ribbon domain-containing OB-fold protein n=1 Tax=Frankia sp. CcI49 TaxID=1745382 RepID=UPI001F51862B|nr:OB-fold domain-containing protein [Frankia sp. CcI49]